MIDLHVHSRDGKQAYKDTALRCIKVAYAVGIDGILVMPNTAETLTSEKTIYAEFGRQDEAIEQLDLKGKFYAGVWIGATADADQLKEGCELYDKHRKTDKRIGGFKYFAGRSTGNLGIIEPEEQKFVWHNFAEQEFEGTVAVHAEEESLMQPKLWNPYTPFTHTLARPPEAEVESIKNQIIYAEQAKFKGTMHICHISVPDSLDVIENARRYVRFKITCGLTPHHATLNDEVMFPYPDGLYGKMNPPLRTESMRKEMKEALINGKINCTESDHAHHTKKEKTDPTLEKPFASGIPVLHYWPFFIKDLRKKLSWEQIHKITHDNVIEIIGIDIPNSKRIEEIVEGEIPDLSGEYEYDAFKLLNEQ